MKTPILILHAWGKDMKGEKYKELGQMLEKAGHKVYAPDLPGFGENPLPKESFLFDDYVAFVKDFITKIIRAKKVILLGHSFGGRIAIRFTAENSHLVDALILTGSSGIIRKPSLKKQIVSTVTKIAKPLFSIPPFSFFYKLFRKGVYYSIGELDYYKAGAMSETFKNVYKVSIAQDLRNIPVPTLLVWGENDTFTPLADGEYMHKNIENSTFVTIPNASHRLPYEDPVLLGNAVTSFLS